MGNNNHHKEKGIRIIDSKKIDYTFTGKEDSFNIRFSSYSGETHQVNQKQKEGILID